MTVTGATLGEQLAGPFEWPDWQDVIRPPHDPLQEQGALIALRGSLAPDGSVLKRSAASPGAAAIGGARRRLLLADRPGRAHR